MRGALQQAGYLAERAELTPASGIRRIFDLAATLKNPIDLSIGQPDFDVLPPIKTAAIEAIQQGRNGYTVTHGIPALRERIQSELRREFEWSPPVLVTSGVSGGLVLALMATVNPGDEVIVLDPAFVSYAPLVHLFNGTAVRVNLYDSFQLDPDRVEAAISDRTKAILINSPSNPTGVVYSTEDIEAVCKMAADRSILIISDEIYNKLAFDGSPVSPVQFSPKSTLLLRGFGKTYGMTGWRLGYAAGPSEVIGAMARLQQYTFVCAPHPVQVAGVTALDTDVTAIIDEYRHKRDLVVSELKGHFDFVKPSGGFFVYPKVPSGYDSGTQFVEAAIAKNVLIIPGSAFSQQDTHFRISYAVHNDKLVEGCRILKSLI
jgi:aspartate/methionine/tyrosine aminotransferase